MNATTTEKTTRPAALDLDAFTGHTPGPWVAERAIVKAQGGAWIASCPWDQPEWGDKREPQAHAEARLIAAAPALLAECRRLTAENKRLREALELKERA